ncbi:alpha/beta hydrolase [Mesosutterella sp. OilRF-GAM-744-9]|uniref:Alpha/beta hydrolase n=1 Tax=Mesosutterella porci TaxID=2915351 RepID=A0ABS9MN63_9BURK|nr:alpha/beta hydrolase [Mesosutterella sp. oilRF-744-WT-GAM-9]MCG5030051.1 alpha/beta hydrolase [Mesosutterella sp. oilRF-744-WT-GAM-9]
MKKSQRFVKTLQKLAAGIAAAGCAAAAFAAPADGGWFAPLPAVLPAPQHADHGADNFYKSTRLNSENVTFRTQFDTTVSGVLFTPRTMRPGEKLPAIVVGHPMGAVKEQSAALYAQKMAEQGFVTLAIDLPFWGSSSGTPRNSVLPDLYSEAFMAAVDFLGTRSFVEREKIGGIGICGSGSFLISAAKIDPRIKAVATVSMYNMGEVNRTGLGHSQSLEQRKAYLREAAEARYAEFLGASHRLLGGTTHTLDANTDPIQQEFYDFYRTTRGAAAGRDQNLNTTTHPTFTSNVKFMNFYPFQDIETISPRPLLFITGDQAHSREFSEEAFRRAAQPKELYYVRGAGHVDLYDKTDLIPFAKLTAFFKANLK